MSFSIKKQFAICRDRSLVKQQCLDEMGCLQLDEWLIFAGEDLNVYPVLSPHGEVVGVVLGWLTNSLATERGVISAPALRPTESVGEMLIRWTESLSGRYLACLKTEGQLNVVCDPAGQLPALYHLDEALVSSSPMVLHESVLEHQLNSLRSLVEKNHGPFWYPFGLTPYASVKRLLPNHRLLLDEQSVTRIWPTEKEVSKFGMESHHRPNLMPIASVLTSELEKIVASSAALPYLHITGGYDSRITLAASIAIGRKLPLMAVDFKTRNCARDIRIARNLARVSKRPLDIRQLIAARDEDVREWQDATGSLVRDSIDQLPTTQKFWPREEVQISGAGGEVGRAFYWMLSDIEAASPVPHQLLSRLGISPHELLVEEAERWMDGLPVTRASTIYDFLYIEQRLACWAGASALGTVHRIPPHSPFIRRRLFSDILNLDPVYRSKQQFAKDLIWELAPELDSIPFNRDAGIRGLVGLKNLFRLVVPDYREKQFKHAMKSI